MIWSMADFLEEGVEFRFNGINGEIAGVAADLGVGEGGGEFLDGGFDARLRGGSDGDSG